MLSNCSCVTHLTQGQDCSLNQVVRVRRTLRLSQNVSDTNAIQNGTHCTTSYNSGTFRSREDDNLSTAEASALLVRYSTFDNRHLHQVFLGSFYAFGDGGSNFASLTQTVTDNALAVTDNNDCCKSESTTTLGDLNYSIDSNESIL